MVTNAPTPVSTGTGARSNAARSRRRGRLRPRPCDFDVANVERLHALVDTVLISDGKVPPEHIVKNPRLWPWPVYETLLRDANAEPVDVSRLRDMWDRINAEFPTGGPYVVVPEEELVTDTVAEFVVLLGSLRERARLGMTELAKRAGVSRQQLHNILNVKRGVLPAKGKQVESIARACGLSQPQVEAVCELWRKLDRERYHPAPPLPMWMGRPLAGLAAALAWTDPSETEVNDAVLVVGNAIAEEHRHVQAREVAQGLLRAMDERGMYEVSLARLAAAIARLLKIARPDEDVTELVFEAGYVLGQELAERNRMLLATQVVR